jgi:hypothetical protein
MVIGLDRFDRRVTHGLRRAVRRFEPDYVLVLLQPSCNRFVAGNAVEPDTIARSKLAELPQVRA